MVKPKPLKQTKTQVRMISKMAHNKGTLEVSLNHPIPKFKKRKKKKE